jgi:mono/diheme cytochrome c family protein
MFAQRPRDLRQGFLDTYAPDEVIRRVRDGTPLNITLDPVHLQERAREVEDLVTYARRLPAAGGALAGSGRDLYIDRCAVCHGPYGSPGAILPAGVRRPRDLGAPEVQAALTDAELGVLVRHGREGMPALTPRVSEADAHALAAFARLFSRGFELYDRYCAACHGDNGRGTGSFAENFRAPTVVFDRAYFERTDPEHLRKWVWHMAGEQRPSMPHYHWTLTQREAGAIVEFLKSTR